MKRTILQILHVLGWIAFVPFVPFALLILAFTRMGLMDEHGERYEGIEALVPAGMVLMLGLPGLAAVIASRVGLRHLKRRERPQGFEPVMGRVE